MDRIKLTLLEHLDLRQQIEPRSQVANRVTQRIPIRKCKMFLRVIIILK